MNLTQEQKEKLSVTLSNGATRGMLYNNAMLLMVHNDISFEQAREHALERFVEMEEYLKQVTQ